MKSLAVASRSFSKKYRFEKRDLKAFTQMLNSMMREFHFVENPL